MHATSPCLLGREERDATKLHTPDGWGRVEEGRWFTINTDMPALES